MNDIITSLREAYIAFPCCLIAVFIAFFPLWCLFALSSGPTTTKGTCLFLLKYLLIPIVIYFILGLCLFIDCDNISKDSPIRPRSQQCIEMNEASAIGQAIGQAQYSESAIKRAFERNPYTRPKTKHR